MSFLRKPTQPGPPRTRTVVAPQSHRTGGTGGTGRTGRTGGTGTDPDGPADPDRQPAIRILCATVTWSRSDTRTVRFIVHSPAIGRLTESVAQ